MLLIKYSKQAIKFLKKQDMASRTRIISAVESLPSGDVKKLRGTNLYRLRVGDYRIIFDRRGNIIFVEKIDSRGEVYKK